MDSRLNPFQDKMEKTLNNLEEEYAGIRAGRANPHILDKLRVDYYGTPSPIQSVANVSVPEPRMIQIQPWEASMVKEIEKAINCSDIGINPTNDGKLIRLVSLSSQRRDVKILQRTSRRRARKLRLLSAISEGMQSTASRRPAKRKAFQRMRLKASRMTLKSLPTSLSQKLTLRLMQNVKRYLLYSIYIISRIQTRDMLFVSLICLLPFLLFTLNCVTSK